MLTLLNYLLTTPFHQAVFCHAHVIIQSYLNDYVIYLYLSLPDNILQPMVLQQAEPAEMD